MYHKETRKALKLLSAIGITDEKIVSELMEVMQSKSHTSTPMVREQPHSPSLAGDKSDFIQKQISKTT